MSFVVSPSFTFRTEVQRVQMPTGANLPLFQSSFACSIRSSGSFDRTLHLPPYARARKAVNTGKLLTIEEIAGQYGVSRATIYRRASLGSNPSSHLAIEDFLKLL
jgi:hypothetical protein